MNNSDTVLEVVAMSLKFKSVGFKFEDEKQPDPVENNEYLEWLRLHMKKAMLGINYTQETFNRMCSVAAQKEAEEEKEQKAPQKDITQYNKTIINHRKLNKQEVNKRFAKEIIGKHYTSRGKEELKRNIREKVANEYPEPPEPQTSQPEHFDINEKNSKQLFMEALLYFFKHHLIDREGNWYRFGLKQLTDEKICRFCVDIVKVKKLHKCVNDLYSQYFVDGLLGLELKKFYESLEQKWNLNTRIREFFNPVNFPFDDSDYIKINGEIQAAQFVDNTKFFGHPVPWLYKFYHTVGISMKCDNKPELLKKYTEWFKENLLPDLLCRKPETQFLMRMLQVKNSPSWAFDICVEIYNKLFRSKKAAEFLMSTIGFKYRWPANGPLGFAFFLFSSLRQQGLGKDYFFTLICKALFQKGYCTTICEKCTFNTDFAHTPENMQVHHNSDAPFDKDKHKQIYRRQLTVEESVTNRKNKEAKTEKNNKLLFSTMNRESITDFYERSTIYGKYKTRLTSDRRYLAIRCYIFFKENPNFRDRLFNLLKKPSFSVALSNYFLSQYFKVYLEQKGWANISGLRNAVVPVRESTPEFQELRLNAKMSKKRKLNECTQKEFC